MYLRGVLLYLIRLYIMMSYLYLYINIYMMRAPVAARQLKSPIEHL